MTDAVKTALAALLLGLSASFANATAGPVDIDAEVVHSRGDRVYVVARDSTALAVGDLLTLSARGKTVASATVTEVAGEMAVATLTSGSLERVKKLEQVRVSRERPEPRVPGAYSLRIGYPVGGRDNLLIGCGRWSGFASLGSAGFHADSLGPRSFRLRRERSGPETKLQWPDTLLIRLFEESVDEEIAFERGELDVAVFWPGELSAHLRDHPRFLTPVFSTRGALVVSVPGAAGEVGSLAPADDAALAAMNATLFRGDLVRLNESPQETVLPPAGRFEVDGGIPGRNAIAGLLNRGRPSAAAPASPRLRLAFLDAPSRAAELTDAVLFTARFDVRCPIVCAPQIRSVVSDLADELVRFECRP